MKKYHFMRIISSTFIIAYAFLLLPITRGEQPLAENNPILLFSAIIIGTISSIFMFKETIEKQYKKRRQKKMSAILKIGTPFLFILLSP